MSGVKVLPAPLRPEQAELITSAHVADLLTLLKANHDYIVVDTSPLFNDLNLNALEMADDILLIFTRDLPSIKHVKTDLEVLETLNQSHKVKLVLNKSTQDYGIKLTDLQKSLNASPAAILPFDEKTVLSSINKGHPFVMTSTNTRIAQSIKDLALTFEFATTSAPAKAVKKSLFNKIFSI
jgi:pilus assembly protein CpaE